MSFLLDVNVLLAFGWKDHPFHEECSTWMLGLDEFTTCPIVELGFLRISMTATFNASFEDAQLVLASMTEMSSARQLPCDLFVNLVPQVTSYKDTTNAYLIALAKSHSLQLATFDDRLLNKKWADGIAFNPLK